MRYPRHMTLELTAKCNFRCPYCYCVWHEYPELAKPELDLDQWKAVLGPNGLYRTCLHSLP
ncbi:MAG: hypothetical protein IJG70_02920 [Kiritimatiellae bacterium]|nr:hypothetical protein [Kiritimatiellia bacterium]